MSRRVANLGRGPAACSALQLAIATMTTRERSDITLKGLVQRVTPPPPRPTVGRYIGFPSYLYLAILFC